MITCRPVLTARRQETGGREQPGARVSVGRAAEKKTTQSHGSGDGGWSKHEAGALKGRVIHGL